MCGFGSWSHHKVDVCNINFNFEWITLAVKQISGNFMKKLIWVIKEQNMQTFILRGIFASIYVQKWTLVKHDLFWRLARDRKSPWQRRNKSFLYIFWQKLIWRELCSTNSLPSTVLSKKSIIKYSKASCGHPPYPSEISTL